VAGLIVAAFLCFGRLDYRVEAPFALRAEDAAFLSAPFAGYLSEVHVEVGSEVNATDPLASLDARDLLLEEANAIADESRYLREAEKAAGADKPAEMRIAQALAEQARARLEIFRFRRQHAVVRSPFAGVVVEGDLKRRIGAPLKQGDILFRVARLDHLTVECSVSEEDMHELRAGGRGEIAFASLPKQSFPIVIKRIEPVAQPKEHGNVFVVHCVADGLPAGWWRPGMSGVAKLSAGRRSPAWILTHRTLDFVRMHLWW
jgi:multidrug efflux pump subunit AcrA (membrane-fusion protein)